MKIVFSKALKKQNKLRYKHLISNAEYLQQNISPKSDSEKPENPKNSPRKKENKKLKGIQKTNAKSHSRKKSTEKSKYCDPTTATAKNKHQILTTDRLSKH